MEFKSKILSNGLAVIGEVNGSAQSAAVGFFVRSGARDETAEINGVSHFLEHMIFKGTEELDAFEVNKSFDRTGARFNAFTSEENTVYYAAVLPEYLAEITQLWTKLMRPSLRESDFDIEKNVIKEEIAMYKDNPQFEVLDICRNIHFKDHPCGNSVLGSEESITNLRADQMRDYFSRRYSPGNMALVFSGNFDWEAMSSLAEEKCGGWENFESSRELTYYKGSMAKSSVKNESLVREHICLMHPSVSIQDERRYAAALFAMIAGDDTGSRYFWELIDTAIAEAAVMQLESMDGVGAMYNYFSCSPENGDIVIAKAEEIFKELYENGVTEEELRKARNKVLSAVALKNEIPMGRLTDLGMNWIYLNKYRSVAENINSIKAVTLTDVNEIIRDYNPCEFTQLRMGPK